MAGDAVGLSLYDAVLGVGLGEGGLGAWQGGDFLRGFGGRAGEFYAARWSSVSHFFQTAAGHSPNSRVTWRNQRTPCPLVTPGDM